MVVEEECILFFLIYFQSTVHYESTILFIYPLEKKEEDDDDVIWKKPIGSRKKADVTPSRLRLMNIHTSRDHFCSTIEADNGQRSDRQKVLKENESLSKVLLFKYFYPD